MKIYLAASFASDDPKRTAAFKNYINYAAKILRERGHDVFVPHEHQLPNAWDLSNHDWGMAVYGMDIGYLDSCDYVVALSWGKTVNHDGFAWECGFICGKGKRVILVSMRDDAVESLMLVSSAYAWLRGVESLRTYDLEELPLVKTAVNEVS